MIPRVNGLDACREITQEPNTRLIPPVLIRSLNDSASRIPGMDVGADDCISEPFHAYELRTRVG